MAIAPPDPQRPATASLLPGGVRLSDVPSPPDPALRVLRACASNDVPSRQLAEMVRLDPRLTAEILRIVNSAYFGVAHKVTSIAYAVTMIGHRALRNLVLCISVRDVLTRNNLPGFDSTSFAQEALRRAVSARALAEKVGVDPEEGFTVGLLQDFGTLVLLCSEPGRGPRWRDIRQLEPRARLALETDLFGTTHDQLGRAIGDVWKFPEEFVDAIAGHHFPWETDGVSEQTLLTRVAGAADWMASVFSASDKATALAECRQLLSRQFDFDGEGIASLLDGVAEGVSDAARDLGLPMGEQPRLDDVLRDANLRLAEENLSYQELTWRLEKTLAERDKLAAALTKELELAREIQNSLLPGPLSTPPLVAALNLSARQVSGDFFDYFWLSDGCLYFAVADVSGKGMTAALLMAKTGSLFRCLGKAIRSPGALMMAVNAELCETSVRGMFVTMAAGILDPRSGEVRLVNAGNPPALLLTADGSYQALVAESPPLGILADTDFLETRFSLYDSSLHLFSDGLGESNSNPTGTPDVAKLAETFARFTRVPLEERVTRVIRAVHPPEESIQDDVTLLIVSGYELGADAR